MKAMCHICRNNVFNLSHAEKEFIHAWQVLIGRSSNSLQTEDRSNFGLVKHMTKQAFFTPYENKTEFARSTLLPIVAPAAFSALSLFAIVFGIASVPNPILSLLNLDPTKALKDLITIPAMLLLGVAAALLAIASPVIMLVSTLSRSISTLISSDVQRQEISVGI